MAVAVVTSHSLLSPGRNPAELLPSSPHSHEGPQGPWGPAWCCPGYTQGCSTLCLLLSKLGCSSPGRLPTPFHPMVVLWAPSQEALIFQIGKKSGMREGGARDGDAFSLFSFWGWTHPAELTKWKKAVRAHLVCWARFQLLGWLQLGQTGGVSHWSRGSGEVQGTHSSSGSTRHAAGLGDPALGCCSLAAPDARTAAPGGTVSAGISAPGGCRSCKGDRVWVLLRWPTLCLSPRGTGSCIAQPLPAGCWPRKIAAGGIYGGLLEWG